MPTRRTFLGLGSGTAVTLSLLQSGTAVVGQTGENGWGVTGQAPPPPPPGSPADLTVSIRTLAPTDTRAPAGFTFVAETEETVSRTPATGSYSAATDLNFLLAEVYWDTDDGAASFTAPQKSIAPLHLRKDRGIGEHYARVFETAGTHTVNAFVYFPDGRWGTASTTVTVDADDAGYTPANTIVVSANGDFAQAPAADPDNQVTTFAAAWSRLNQLDAPGFTDARILFDAAQGLDFTGSPPRNNINQAYLTRLRVGSWIHGTKGEWNVPTGNGAIFTVDADNTTLESFKLVDTQFTCGYNSLTESGDWPSRLLFCNPAIELLVNNCGDTGTVVAFECNNDTLMKSFYINNYDRTDFGDFLALWPKFDGIFSVTGVRNVPLPDAPAGSRPKFSLENGKSGNSHNGIRASGERMYVCHNHWEARHGWNTGFSPTNNPCIRLGRNNPPVMKCVVARNVIESSIEIQSGVDNDGPGAELNPRHVLLEQNCFVVNELFPRCISSTSGLVTIRNNIMLKHNTPQISYPGAPIWVSFIGFQSVYVRPDGVNDPTFIYGNTLVDLLDDTNRDRQVETFSIGATGQYGDYNHVEISNNLRHEPNMTDGIDQDVDTSSIGWSSAFKGVILNYVKYEGAFATATAPGGTIEIPYAGNILDVDGRQLGQSDFAGLDDRPQRHRLNLDKTYSEGAGEIAVSFDGPGQTATVTNNTGLTWTAGANVRVTLNGGARLTISALASDVANGGTVVFSNPNGYIANPAGNTVLYQQDFQLNKGNALQLAISAEASGIVIRNNSSGHLPAAESAFLILDTGDTPLPAITRFAHPDGVPSLFRPNAPIAPEAGLLPLHDITGTPRNGSGHPSAAVGTPSQGASEPV
jgi:hypothetical protein